MITDPPLPLARTKDSMVAGVCGGLAQWLGWDATPMRIVWVGLTFCTVFFPGIFLYLLLWLMMPGPNDGAVSSGQLARSRRHSIIGGVCGGIADWLGWDPTSVRILYVVLSICSAAFPGTIVYIALWFLMPREDEVGSPL